MNTRTFTAAAFAVVLSTSLAVGQQESAPSAATQTQPASQPGMSASQPAVSGAQGAMPSARPDASGARSGGTQPGTSGEQAGADFTDARTFLRQELVEQKLRNEIFEMAQNKAQSEAIKKLARNELERRLARERLRELAREMNIEERDDQAEMVPGSRVRQLRQLRDRLQAESGQEFDRTFANEIAGLHQTDAARYQAAIDRAKEERVKEWARENLPRIRENLQAARQAYQEQTGTAWTPGQQRFIPTARYEMRSGQQSAPSPGASAQPSSPMSNQGTPQ